MWTSRKRNHSAWVSDPAKSADRWSPVPVVLGGFGDQRVRPENRRATSMAAALPR